MNETNKKTTAQVNKRPVTNGTRAAAGSKGTAGAGRTGAGRTGAARKKNKNTDEVVRKGFKRTSGFMFRLLINLIIVFVVVSIFSYSFNFAYSIFSDVAKDPDSTQYVIVEISNDSSVINIGEALEDAGIIENKYSFYIRMNLKKYSGKIKSGKFGLSPSMTFEEIAQIICDLSEEE